MEIHREERGLTFSRIERKTPVVRPAVQSILHSRRQRGGEGPNGQVVSLKKPVNCTNQQPPQRGGAVPDPVCGGSKWVLSFPRVLVTSSTPLIPLFFLVQQLTETSFGKKL